MKLFTILLTLALIAPVCAHAKTPVTIELGTGAAFEGANGDDETVTVSDLFAGYNLGDRWVLGLGYTYDGMFDFDSLERLFIGGRYKVKDNWPFWLEVRIGYTNSPDLNKRDFTVAPGLSTEIALSDEMSSFALAEISSDSNIFIDSVTMQNAVKDGAVRVGVRFRPVVE